jgi:aldehyde dehydrogenase (NAD+)
VAAVKSGDPRDSATDVGPMVSEKQWLRVQGYIRKGIEEGRACWRAAKGDRTARGRLVCASDAVCRREQPMTIARDEIFGPVLCVIPYQDEAEAIAIANDTEYGLSAMVLGGDVDRARRVAQQIVSGRVLVNTLAHEPKAPFGGFKHSGVGREMGEWGIRAFMEPRSMVG